MNSIEIEDLEFTINVLQKTLIDKDDQIKQVQDLHQIQLKVLLEEIDDRDEQIDNLNAKIELLEQNMDNQIQELNKKCSMKDLELNSQWLQLYVAGREHHSEKSQLNDKIEQYERRANQQAEMVTSLTKQIEALKKRTADKIEIDQALFRHIQRSYGCNAVWTLADLKIRDVLRGDRPCFEVKKRSNLKKRKIGQSASYIDIDDNRFNICDKCVNSLNDTDFLGKPLTDVRTSCRAKNEWLSYSLGQVHCRWGTSHDDNNIYKYKSNTNCPYLHCNLE